MSPSPSMSAAKTDFAPRARVEITRCGPKVPASLVFWYQAFLYQATLLSKRELESTSKLPLPSMSAAKTELAPGARVEITC